jgi:hypothetical protein
MRSEDGTNILPSLFQAASDMMWSPYAPSNNLAQALSSLTQISTFHFVMKADNLTPTTSPRGTLHPYTVVGFLSALPRLEVAVVEGVFGRPKDVVPDPDAFWRCFATIWDNCPRLQKLEIRGLGGVGARAGGTNTRLQRLGYRTFRLMSYLIPPSMQSNTL